MLMMPTIARMGARAGLHVHVKPLSRGRPAREARVTLARHLGDAGVDEGAIYEATIVVSELASNALKHGQPPYELRIFYVGRGPVWCEVFDGGQEMKKIPDVFAEVRRDTALSLELEGGRGLYLAHHLTRGYCDFYRTRKYFEPCHGKAVAFALPTPYTEASGSPVEAPMGARIKKVA